MAVMKQNIDYWIGRILIVFSFIFFLSFLNNDTNTGDDSNSNSIEQVGDICYSAILAEPLDFPSLYILCKDCDFNTLQIHPAKFEIRISNNRTNQQFNNEELKFFNIKPGLLQLCRIRIQDPAKKVYPSIS